MNAMSADNESILNADFSSLFLKGNNFVSGMYANWFDLIYQTCHEIELESMRLELDDIDWLEIMDCSEKYRTLRFVHTATLDQFVEL
ncbi:MAG: hypothetical protein Q7U42_11530, partial [Parvibaculum sp.]|nr:hypothetical protein [Parvibaculum sp.]